MKKYKLNGRGRAALLIITVLVLGSIAYFVVLPRLGNSAPFSASPDNGVAEQGSSSAKPSSKPTATTDAQPVENEDGTIMTVDDNADASGIINLSLDQFIGYAPIIEANGGYTTTPDSIFGKLGIKVNISVIDDPTTSSNALIKGTLNAAGYTLNRVAFLSQKFQDAGKEIIFPLFTSYSYGADGIVAVNSIQSIADLRGKSIGVPQFGESQAMLIWLVNESDDLTPTEKTGIIDNLILFAGAEETGEAFFAGQIDAAATWQPYLSMANGNGKHILIDTKVAKTFIMSGVVFDKEFAEKHSDVVSAFMDGVYQASSAEWENFNTLRKVMPLFAEMTDDGIREQFSDVEFTTYAENKAILARTAPAMFATQCQIWQSIGEYVDESYGTGLFPKSYNEALAGKYSATRPLEKTEELTESQKQEVVDKTALLNKSTVVEFLGDMAEFKDPDAAREQLKSFVETAKILDGAIIRVEGNVNAVNDTEVGRKLSESRAETVRQFLIQNGIDPNRIIALGNGNTKMKVEVGSPNESINRRTDVFFVRVEGLGN